MVTRQSNGPKRKVTPRHIGGSGITECAQNCNWLILDDGLPCNSFIFDPSTTSCTLARWDWTCVEKYLINWNIDECWFFPQSPIVHLWLARQRCECNVQDGTRWMFFNNHKRDIRYHKHDWYHNGYNNYNHKHQHSGWRCMWQPIGGEYYLQKRTKSQKHQRWFDHRLQFLRWRVRKLWWLPLLDVH